MVNQPLTVSFDPDLVLDREVALALAYTPVRVRMQLTALWAFDARLAAILKTTRDPLVGQMRLTWWHEAIANPGTHRGEPVLEAIAKAGLETPGLQRIVTGWEALLDGEDDAAIADYAAGRGGGIFTIAARHLRADDAVSEAGAGWALVDLARHHSRPEVGRRALALAAENLAAAPRRWSKPARPLGMLTKLARRDLDGPEPQGSPRRIAAMALLALTGR